LYFFFLFNGDGVHLRACALLFLVLDDALRLFFVVVIFGAEASSPIRLATVLQMLLVGCDVFSFLFFFVLQSVKR
jgi:steroid 5-alpha reductase family enzyme